MRILIDIGHPGHVHLFRPFALEMQNRGHKILFTCRQKEFEVELLRAAGFNFKSFGKHFSSIPGKLFGLLKFDIQMIKAASLFKPDLFLSHGSIYATHIAWLFRKPHISFEDTFNFEQIFLYKPFTSVILTSDYSHPNLGEKDIRYKGYHELAYLHPNQFRPNNNILRDLKLQQNEKYCIVRFVSWEATHDYNHQGISLKNKIYLVKELQKYAKVFISSEKELPNQLKKYSFNLPSYKMHDAIAFASLIYGESATMASESAVLGVPAIYLDNVGRYYTKEQEEKYGLVYNYTESEEDQKKSIDKAIEILSSNKYIEKIQEGHRRLLKDKIDVTAFLVWFVENYPGSIKVMKENPNYQINFK